MEFITVRLENAGIYECTASNEAGNASREIELKVQGNRRFMKVLKHRSVV